MANIINSTNIRHPNTFSLNQGKTLLSKELEAINQSIRLILTTAKGELFGDPNFGCKLYEYIYEYEGPALAQILQQEVASSLNQQESRIFLEEGDVNVIDLGETVVIDIFYNLRYTDYRESYQYIAIRQLEEVAQ